ncbi:MAG: hypothetical protein C4K48_08365 [Candidatus Thorarchaeota archaeon]|nr:MAG: hypothetical protein C4K48_08365 [Candidatus Thorarchaeota archaeon]
MKSLEDNKLAAHSQLRGDYGVLMLKKSILIRISGKYGPSIVLYITAIQAYVDSERQQTGCCPMACKF